MRWTRWVIMSGLAMAVPCLWAAHQLDAAEPSTSPGTAPQRVLATIRAATLQWPEARAALQDASAAEARARSEGSAGSPFVAWTSEGIDGSLSRTDNAQDALLLGVPFNWPGQSSAARDYATAATDAAELARSMVGIEVARETSALWLEQAAWIERVAVRRSRLERIDTALAVQEARYQLGEVSGSEVMQLDLEHVRETSQLAAAEAEAAARSQRLRELCGDGCAGPLLGDLAALVDASATPSATELSEGAIEAGGMLRRQRAAGAALRAGAELEVATAFGRPVAAVEWEHVPSISGVPSFDAWGFMVELPLPIGRAGRQRQAAARAEAAAIDERAEGYRRELLRRLLVAHDGAESAMSRLAALNTAVGELERIQHSLDQQFRLGAISYLVFLDGVNRLDDIRFEAIAVREQLLHARLEMATILSDPEVFPVPAPDEESE